MRVSNQSRDVMMEFLHDFIINQEETNNIALLTSTQHHNILHQIQQNIFNQQNKHREHITLTLIDTDTIPEPIFTDVSYHLVIFS